DGTFVRAGVTNGLSYPVLAADVNGDGTLDLISLTKLVDNTSGSLQASRIDVYLGKGDGTFQPRISTTVPHGYLLDGAALDLNQDGLVDLVLIDGGGALDVFTGNGDGTFRPPLRYDAPGILRAILADLNDDGLIDILAGDTILFRTR